MRRYALGNASSRALGTLMGIPDGPEGTRVTLAMMRRLVKDAALDPSIARLLDLIIAQAPAKNFYREAELIHDWINKNVRYQNDPDGVEQIATPTRTLDTLTGDCDDMAVLDATLLRAAGHPARFVAVAFEPDAFSHVYTETLIGSKWVPSDPSENYGFGWAPDTSEIVSKQIAHI